MNCDSCQGWLSDHIEGTLGRDERVQVSSHLEQCGVCASMYDDISTIVSGGADYREHLLETPPNPQALWLRISNIIETEAQPSVEFHPAHLIAKRKGWWARSWQFTMPQLAGAAAVLVIGVAGITALGLRSFTSHPASSALTAPPARAGKATDQAREQQIAYWDQRVQERKAQWNQQTREAFDRNLQVLDQAVADYRHELQINPNDEVSAEMLDSALNEKMALLQDFAE